MKIQQQMFALIEAQRAGEKTISAFCAEHDLNYAKFNYWRRKFDALTDRTNGFVQIKPAAPLRPTAQLCLHLPDGSSLSGSADQLATFYCQIRGGHHA